MFTMKNAILLLIGLLNLLSITTTNGSAHGFVIQSSSPHISRTDSRCGSSSALQGSKENEQFPVLSKIQGINWEGVCRYTDANLQPANFLLQGGTRYDLEADQCTLTSFLAFPDGRTRQVQMKGKRGSLERPSFRLDPPKMEDGTDAGPIYMVITELAPDTVLLNEVDKASGKIVLTSSLSIVNNGQEIVQVSHEVGEGKHFPIEGHQVWRLKKTTTMQASETDKSSYITGGNSDKDELFRGTTGR